MDTQKKTIMVIPVPSDGNTIYVLDIDFASSIVTYRRGFNPKQKIDEDFIIHDGMVCTALIHFPVQWLELWNESN